MPQKGAVHYGTKSSRVAPFDTCGLSGEVKILAEASSLSGRREKQILFSNCADCFSRRLLSKQVRMTAGANKGNLLHVSVYSINRYPVRLYETRLHNAGFQIRFLIPRKTIRTAPSQNPLAQNPEGLRCLLRPRSALQVYGVLS